MSDAVLFRAATHLDQVNDWHRARGIRPVVTKMLPEIGYLVPDVAAGFLYQTDSQVVLLDGFVTNPALPVGRRSRAIDEITDALLRKALEVQAGIIVVLTRDGSISRRALKFGFSDSGPCTMLTKEVR